MSIVFSMGFVVFFCIKNVGRFLRQDNTNWRAGGPGGLEGRVSKWKR